MPKFRVTMGATAAVTIALDIEAPDEYEARAIAEKMEDRREIAMIAGQLLDASDIAIEAYAETSGTPVVSVSFETDENGFDILDVEETDETEGN